MNIYRKLKVFARIRSPFIRKAAIWLLHASGRRYLAVFLDPVLACNLRCRMCYFSDPVKRAEYHGMFTPQELQHIAAAFFKRVLKLQIGCGAEPTLYKQLPELIALGKQYKVPYISITTNGQLLQAPVLGACLASGLDEITLSMHGVKPSTYETFMCGASFPVFLEMLRNLNELKKKYPNFKIRINYTMNADNTEELKDFFKDFGFLNLDVLQLRLVQQIGESEYRNFNHDFIFAHYDEIIGMLKSECAARGISCLAPSRKDFTRVSQAEEDPLVEAAYCYISPRQCWREDFDFRTQTFGSYCRLHKIGFRYFKAVFSGSRHKSDGVTKKMNYEIN